MSKSDPLLTSKQQQPVTPNEQLLMEKVSAGPHVCRDSAGFLHYRFKKPFSIASQHRGDLLPHLQPGYTNTVDDAAQVCLIDAYQLGQPVLAHACRVHSELKIGVDTPLLVLCKIGCRWGKAASKLMCWLSQRHRCATVTLAVTQAYVK